VEVQNAKRQNIEIQIVVLKMSMAFINVPYPNLILLGHHLTSAVGTVRGYVGSDGCVINSNFSKSEMSKKHFFSTFWTSEHFNVALKTAQDSKYLVTPPL
jgi:hypothetical protein